MQAREPIPMPGIPDRVMSCVLWALLADASPKRCLKVAQALIEEADRREFEASRLAGVYSIRDGGLMFGERPQDRDSLEVARILRSYADYARRMSC